MNHYPHHIGDYLRSTAHLNFLEDAAYSRLLRKYYDDEAALPDDLPALCRLLRAHTRAEKAAVGVVLREFFTLGGDGRWHNARADREIEIYRQRSSSGREGGKTASERQAKPKQTSKQNPSEIQANAKQPEPEPEKTKPLSVERAVSTLPPPYPPNAEARAWQTASEIQANPRQTASETPGEPEPKSLTEPGRICRLLRAEGLSGVNPGSPLLLELIGAGATDDEFVFTAKEAASKGCGFNWLLKAIAGRRRDAAKIAGEIFRGEIPKSKSQMRADWNSEFDRRLAEIPEKEMDEARNALGF